MAKIVWDADGERFYETGVSHGVLFTKNQSDAWVGEGWNGLTSVSDNPEGGEPEEVYADDIVYLNLMSVEKTKATIEAYMYPDSFKACLGMAEPTPGVIITGQKKKKFAFSYRTRIGNDEDSELGYKLHIIYGCLAGPSEQSHETVNDSPEAMTFSWDVSTTPVEVEGYKPMAHLILDSTKFTTPEDKARLKAVEDKLYGSENEEPTLLMPDEIFTLLRTNG